MNKLNSLENGEKKFFFHYSDSFYIALIFCIIGGVFYLFRCLA